MIFLKMLQYFCLVQIGGTTDDTTESSVFSAAICSAREGFLIYHIDMENCKVLVEISNCVECVRANNTPVGT